MRGSSPRLPTALVDFLDGGRLSDKTGLACILATSTRGGHPHLAMLSVGELLVVSPSRLHLALHRTSGSSRALSDNGQALLSAIVDGAAYQIELSADVVDVDHPSAAAFSYFRANVTAARQERAPYAEIESGVTFRLTDPERTLERWQSQLKVLRTL